MTNLSVRSFRTYFRAVHGTDPFPWQQRLLEQVSETGRWPEALDLPTGSGKTAALDVALFHLALEATRPERRAPTRILFVVDRRTIVDQAHARAVQIQKALLEPKEPIVATVAARLSSLTRERSPLQVTVLRGGIARDDGWARTPDQPLIAISTVDQVGSRLLFRGYGVSDSMRPVHAGLLGNDALLLLDEVHLSLPFVETLEQLGDRYMRWAERPLERRWQWVPMSATPRVTRKKAFRLDEEDKRHRVLARRLEATRPAALKEVAVRGDGDVAHHAFVGALCEEALRMTRPGRTLGAVVNRVATARSLFSVLRQQLGSSADVWLLTGRMRPLEREALEVELRARVGAGRKRAASDRPAVVVATQCIEAGADFDFDALVTECASLDSLRQRFGRLNRLGEIDDPEGAILVRKDALKSDDPIYGKALGRTWAYLSSLKAVDFGITRFRLPGKQELEELLPPVEHAPVLLPAHLDAWVQTAPIPAVDPEVALWLHGPERGEAEVSVVWRADLTGEMLGSGAEAAVIERVESCPPSAPEALVVPLSAVRRWLNRGAEPTELSDVEGVEAARLEPREPRSSRMVVLWRGEHSELAAADRIRPGDTIVVPSEYGGVADGSWAPDSSTPVMDLGDQAYTVRHGKPLLRLHSAVLASIASSPGVGSSSTWKVPVAPSEEEDHDEEALRAWLESVLGDDSAPRWLKESAAGLSREFQRRRRPRTVRQPGILSEPPHFVLVGRTPLRFAYGLTTEDDTASFTGAEVPLRAHLRGVGEFARDFAQRSGLASELVEDLALAGAWHDAGKADSRFQAMLHGGSRFRADVAPEPLAKSSIPATDRASREAARERAGYPKGARHELVSLALLTSTDRVRKSAHDWDLVQHLVSSHHGHCRPFAPLAQDPAPIDVPFDDGTAEFRASSDHGFQSFGSGVSDRFWRLVRRYGWFGLAWLEAILRLADHRRSEYEQRAEHEEGA